MKRRHAAGFTLIELVLALTILAILVTILFGGLRVGLRAWQRGEARAATLQHSRSMTQLLEEALAGTYPYTGIVDKDNASTAVVFFKGEPDRMFFVTVSPPLPLSPTIPFVAVSLQIDSGNSPGFSITEKAMPNFDPFEPLTPLIVDPTIAEVKFRYQRDGGSWEESWDGVQERTVPRAVVVTITAAATESGPGEKLPVLYVPIRVNLP